MQGEYELKTFIVCQKKLQFSFTYSFHCIAVSKNSGDLGPTIKNLLKLYIYII